MPFWQQVKRCENCAFWVSHDPADTTGRCTYFDSAKRPPWLESATATTAFDEGRNCTVYRHQPDKPHPLERAEPTVALLQVGDRITLRTYERGAVSRTKATVLKHLPDYLAVEAFNGRHRLRRRIAYRGYAGALVGMESWGIDLDAPIERAAPRKEHPERAVGMLSMVARGQWLPLIGYPPRDGERIKAQVIDVKPGFLTIKIGTRKARMYRKEPLAGIIEGEVFVLDTTGEQQG